MTKRIKILLVISALGQGGAERVITYIASYLNSKKYEISLILYEKKGKFLVELPKDIHIYDLKKKSRWDFIRLIGRTRKIIKEAKPDIVLSFLFYSNILTSLSVLFLKRSFRIIFSERNYPPEYLRRIRFGWIKKRLMIFTYQKADIIISNSEATKVALEKEYGISSDKLKTVYNPIDLEKVRRKSLEEVPHPFFQDEGLHVIIGVGRLEDQKRFDRLLRVFSLVKKQNEKARLIVLGEGKLLNNLEELASKLELKSFVEFAGSKANPYAWISKAEVFVLSSDYEGFPNVVLEAMACATPVVSTDCPSGPNEIITHGKNGFLVPPRDEEGLAVAIKELLDQKELRQSFAEEGRKKIEEFKMEEILPQFEALFESEFQSAKG